MQTAYIVLIVSVILVILLVGGGVGAYFLTKPEKPTIDAGRSDSLIKASRDAADKKAALITLTKEIDAMLAEKVKATPANTPIIQAQIDQLLAVKVDLEKAVKAAEDKETMIAQAQGFADDATSRSLTAKASADAALASATSARTLGNNQTDSQLAAIVNAVISAANASAAAYNSGLAEVAKANTAVTVGNVPAAQAAAGNVLLFAKTAAEQADFSKVKLDEATLRLKVVTDEASATTAILESKRTALAQLSRDNDALIPLIRATHDESRLHERHTDSNAATLANAISKAALDALALKAQAAGMMEEVTAALTTRNVSLVTSKLDLVVAKYNAAVSKHDEARTMLNTLRTRLALLAVPPPPPVVTPPVVTPPVVTPPPANPFANAPPPPAGRYIIESIGTPGLQFNVEGSVRLGNYYSLDPAASANSPDENVVRLVSAGTNMFKIYSNNSTTLGWYPKTTATGESIQIGTMSTALGSRSNFIIRQVATDGWVISLAAAPTLAWTAGSSGSRPRSTQFISPGTPAQQWKLTPA